ncbi:MAG: hypothetical protein Q9171_003612, partial [Xanthocarpia ochracea]
MEIDISTQTYNLPLTSSYTSPETYDFVNFHTPRCDKRKCDGRCGMEDMKALRAQVRLRREYEREMGLRREKREGAFVLKVPFLEGPKMTEGVEYARVVSSIILPEGASNVKYETSVPLVDSEVTLHRTFMDTVGRTTLKLTALNLADDWRDRDIIITYEYSTASALRKPLTILTALLGVFVAAWAVGK